MAVGLVWAVECVRSVGDYSVLVHTNECSVKNLRNWAQNAGMIPIDISLIGLEEQKVIFSTIRPSPSQYLLYYTELAKVKMYRRLKSLILLHVDDNSLYGDINMPTKDISSVLVVSSIKTYVYDLIVQLRYNRFIHTGVPTYLLDMLQKYSRYLAICNGIEYVVPEMVQTAFRDVIPFQIRDLLINDASEEMTMLYGSDAKLINQVREIINEYDVMTIVLDQVPHT